MPFSTSVFDVAVSGVLRNIAPATALDIGAGAGKYGKLIKAASPECIVTAIELYREYVERFSLHAIYDEVQCGDALALIETAVDKTYDLVVFGDVLEHFRKSYGVDLLNFFVYRSRYILALFPSDYVQNSVEGNRAEAHLSIWSENDFAGMRHSPVYSIGKSHMVVIAGYLAQPADLARAIAILQDQFTGPDPAAAPSSV